MNRTILSKVRNGSIVLLSILVAVLCFGGITFGQTTEPPPTQQEGDSGSAETVKETPLRFPVVEFNRYGLLFESVLNDHYMQQEHYSQLKFYLAPLLHLVPVSKTEAYHRLELPELGIVRYSFRLQNYASSLSDQALMHAGTRYSSQTGMDNAFSIQQISLMEHGAIVISPQMPEQIRQQIAPFTLPSNPNAPIDSKVSLRPNEDFHFDVPVAIDSTFRALLENQSLPFDFTVFYNARDVSMAVMTLKAEDLLNTDRYKSLQTSGAAFVSAQQGVDMVKEAITKQNINILIDKGVEDRVVAFALELFKGLVEDAKAVEVTSAQEAATVDAELARGIGLSPADFQPITLMWSVQDIIKNASTMSTANEAMKQWYEQNKNQIESTREKLNEQKGEGGLNVGVNLGIVKVGGGGGYNEMNRILDKQQTASLADEINQGLFKDQATFNDTKESLSEANGFRVDIVARGLNLVERSTFENKLKSFGQINISLPSSRVASFTVTDTPLVNVAAYTDALTSLADRLIQIEGAVHTNSANQVAVGSGENPVYVSANGSLGVGLTDPEALLDVNGRIVLRPGSNPNGSGMVLRDLAGENDRAFIGMESDDIVRIWGSPMAANGITMNVNNGNVGLGVTNAGEHLSIAGQGNQGISILSDNGSHTRLLSVASNGQQESQLQFQSELHLLEMNHPQGPSTLSLRYGEVTVGGNLQVNGQVTIPGNLQVDGQVTIPGSLRVDGPVSLPGPLVAQGGIEGRLKYTGEFVADTEAPPLQMIHSSQGFCFLTGIWGEFEHDSRSAHVYIDDSDGYWYLDSGPHGVGARARCAGTE